MSEPLVIDQQKLFERMGFEPHIGQRDILEDQSRFKVVTAGRRFGKSELGGNLLVTEAVKAYYRRGELESAGKRAEYWIVGPEYSDAEKEFRILWNRLKAKDFPFDRPGSYYDPNLGNMRLSLWDGRFQVIGKSAKYPDTLVGEGLHGAILAEAAKLKENIWLKYIRPTLSDFNGWALMTSTPEGRNWFYEAYLKGQGIDPSWNSWRKPSWVNPHVYKRKTTTAAIKELRERFASGLGVDYSDLEIDPEIAQLVLDSSEEIFNQEIAADFTDYVGKVFKDFDYSDHVGDFEFNPNWRTFAAVDYGYTNPNVWLLLQVDPHDEQVIVLDEVYESGLTAEDFANVIRSRGLCPLNLEAFYPDPASPGDTRMLERKLGVRSRSGNVGIELKERLDLIRKGLRRPHSHLDFDHVDNKPRLMFDRKCVKTLQDMENYRYPDNKDHARNPKNQAEAPLKVNDHGPEALGRFYGGYFWAKQNAKPVRITKAF